jgi:CBS domain-containing membrane protein
VLLYGAPQVEYAQPRNLVGGHILSALVGITVYKLMPDNIELASALAVSLAVVVMHYTKTIHPPGGATALIAVIGSNQVHALGYMFVLSPVLLGASVMLLVALVVNNLSANPKRHYPVFWW